ncbi:MAG: ABC transporter substrate-binding protein [Methanomicrobiaceae archaeon]|nr:ABC transporter substrate-binding protein [Methanomicrobiaceae archaeon]
MNTQLLALLCAVICITACTIGCTEQTTTDEIRIGVVASMTGPASTTGKDIWQSAVLAADEINAEGGVYVAELGKKIPLTLVLGDDESTREGGQKAVSRLITQDGVHVLVGGFSSAVVSAHQSIVAEYQVPYLVSGASSSAVSRRTDIDTSYMFFHRPNAEDSAEVTVLFIDRVLRPAINEKFVFPEERPLRLAIIYQDTSYGKGQQTAVHDHIARYNLSIDVVAEETFKMGESDFRTTLTSVGAADPDAIYTVTFLNELIPLVQQGRRDVGLNTLFFGIEPNDDPDFYSGVGNYGDSTSLQSRFSPYTAPKGHEAAHASFVQNFEELWGGSPGMMGVATYEAIYIAAQAIEDAGTLDKATVRDALRAVEMPQMVEAMKDGTISFSEEWHESKFELYMSQLVWDENAGEPRPLIVYPDVLSEGDFVLPEWYEPGEG